MEKFIKSYIISLILRKDYWINRERENPRRYFTNGLNGRSFLAWFLNFEIEGQCPIEYAINQKKTLKRILWKYGLGGRRSLRSH